MPTLKIIRLLLFAAIALLISQSSRGQNLNLDLGTSIKGESTLQAHPNTIDCYSFSLNTTNSGAGILFGDLVVSKALDKSSPQLFLASAQSTVISTATLYSSKLISGGMPADYYIIKLTNAKVSSISQSGNASDRPSETITLRYQKIEIDYYPVNSQGQLGNEVIFRWDLTTNSTF